MKLLNVYVYVDEKDHRIKIRFDALYDEELEKPIMVSPLDFSSSASNLESYYPDHKNEIQELINLNTKPSATNNANESVLCPEKVFSKAWCSMEEEVQYNFHFGSNQAKKRSFIIERPKVSYEKHTVIYVLPTTPLEAIYFILCCAHNVTRNYPAIFFGLPLDEDSVDLGLGAKNIDCKTNFITTLLKLLYELPNPPLKYGYVLEALRHLNKHYPEKDYKNNQVFFLIANWVNLEKRCDDLYAPVSRFLLEPVESNTQKLSGLLTLARTYIHHGQKDEFNYMIQSLNLVAKKQLYRRAMSNKSGQFAAVGWVLPECHFICHAEFIIRKDGHMAIVDIPNNYGYNSRYLPESKAPFFEKDINELMKSLGLELELSLCNYTKELVFTESSTKILMGYGLHWSITYLKNCLHLLNQVFVTASILNRTLMPRDVTKILCDKAFFNASTTNLVIDEVEKIGPGCLSLSNSC